MVNGRKISIPDDLKIGSIHSSNSYGDFEIVDYMHSSIIDVKFIDTGFFSTATASRIRRGAVKDPLKPVVYGFGFYGVGEYKSRVNGDKTMAYKRWVGMIARCYCERELKKRPRYRECSICDEWRNFQNFAKWFYFNYPRDGREYQLDKDIKIDGNREYSPDACTFVTLTENNVKAQAKFYKFKSPSGDVVQIYNLSEFCRCNNLNKSHMVAVNNGRRIVHLGWTRHVTNDGYKLAGEE